MTAPSLPEFILARVAEDERPCVCLEYSTGACGGGWCREDCRVCSGGDATTRDEATLRRGEAIQRIVGHAMVCDEAPRGGWCYCCHEALRNLASFWADHPDFRPEWRA